MFKTKKPIKNCLLLEFNTQKDLALAFCRVEEYYEGNPKVNGKYLSFVDFIDAFMTDEGKLDYFHYWTGFNIPGDIFMKWSQNNMSDKTYWEIALADAVYKKIDFTKPFYIIGGKKGDMEVIDHEIAHALYYMNEDYKNEMSDITYDFYKTQRSEYTKTVKTLKKMGYGENVIKDEIQAYLSTSGNKELVEKFGLNLKKIKTIRTSFRKVLSRYNTSKKKT
jgi:hypothetical protein